MFSVKFRSVIFLFKFILVLKIGLFSPVLLLAESSFDLPLTSQEVEKLKPNLIDAIQCGAATLTEWGVVTPVAAVSTVAGLLLLIPGIGVSCLDGKCDLSPDHKEKTKLDSFAKLFSKPAGWVTVPAVFTDEELNQVQDRNCKSGRGHSVY